MPIYTNSEGAACAEKLVQKMPKKLFRILPAALKYWPKKNFSNALGELGKSIWLT